METTITNGIVAVELGQGFVILNWPHLGITFGPAHAVVMGSETEFSSRGRAGQWSIAAATDEAGARAVFQEPEQGFSFTVQLWQRAGHVEITAAYQNPTDRGLINALVLLRGQTNMAVTRRLVEGYDSWAYSGVRTNEAGSSCWNSAFVDHAGRALAIQAVRAEKFCTRVEWTPNDNDADGGEISITAGATPELTPVVGTWGYQVGDAGGLKLPSEGGVISEPVIVGAGADALSLVEDLTARAAQAGGARRWRGKPIRGWESWYHYGLTAKPQDILTNAKIMRSRYSHRPDIDVVQIDDGWQVAYGAWWPNADWTDSRGNPDFQELVGNLRSIGVRPGIWIAPFRVQPGGQGIATDHPDWCIQSSVGGPWREARHKTWCLDATNPDALAALHDLGAQIKAWGFEMVKVDFTYLGAIDSPPSADAEEMIIRCQPARTGIEALRQGWRALVDGLGDDIYTLACGTPTLPVVGLAHANRVGHDLAMPRVFQNLGHPVDEGWTGAHGIRVQARNVAARWAQHGREYEADPEIVMTWNEIDNQAGYPLETARVMATLAVITGGPFLLADQLESLDETNWELLTNPRLLQLLENYSSTKPSGAACFRPTDLFTRADAPSVPQHVYSHGDGIPTTWTTIRNDQTVNAWFNWGDEPLIIYPPENFWGSKEIWTEETIGYELLVPSGAVRVASLD